MESKEQPESQSDDKTKPSEAKTSDSSVDDKQAHIQQRLKELGVSDDSERPEKSWLVRYGNYLMASVILTLIVIYWLEYRTIDNTPVAAEHVTTNTVSKDQQAMSPYGVPYAGMMQQNNNQRTAPPQQAAMQPQSREQWMQQQATRHQAMKKAWEQQQQRRKEWEQQQYQQQVKAWQEWQAYMKQQQEWYRKNQPTNQYPQQQAPRYNGYSPQNPYYR